LDIEPLVVNEYVVPILPLVRPLRVLGIETVSTRVNDFPLLIDPVSEEFFSPIHQVPEPSANAVAGVTEQVPMPEGHPHAEAVYHC